MSRTEQYLNAYEEEPHNVALNNQNVYVSYSGDYKANPIFHVHNSCELLFFEEGAGLYKIKDVDYEVGKNSILIIGGADPHFRKFTRTPCIRYGLTVMPSFLQNLPIINSYMQVYQTHSVKEARKLQNLDPADFQRIIQIIRLLREETRENGEGRGDMVYALLLEMTIILKRYLNLEKQDISGTYKAMSDIKNYIDLHYAEDLNLTVLSRNFYIQPNTISKNFKKIFGKNVVNYINSVRIANAVRILEESHISITELAGAVGYSSMNTFLRQFRDIMGISPLQYKKQMEQYKTDSGTMHTMWNDSEEKREYLFRKAGV